MWGHLGQIDESCIVGAKAFALNLTTTRDILGPQNLSDPGYWKRLTSLQYAGVSILQWLCTCLIESCGGLYTRVTSNVKWLSTRVSVME